VEFAFMPERGWRSSSALEWRGSPGTTASWTSASLATALGRALLDEARSHDGRDDLGGSFPTVEGLREGRLAIDQVEVGRVARLDGGDLRAACRKSPVST